MMCCWNDDDPEHNGGQTPIPWHYHLSIWRKAKEYANDWKKAVMVEEELQHVAKNTQENK